MNGSLLCPLSQSSRRWSGRPIDARALFSGFSSRQKPCPGPAFPAFLNPHRLVGLSRNRFLRIPCSGVHSLGRLFGSIYEAAAMKFPRPDEGGGSNLARFPRMAGNSLQDAANSLLGSINSLFGAN